ncbi:chemotaxis protein CheX [Gammaproteobacteria bacterium]
MTITKSSDDVVLSTEDVLLTLCNSVVSVLTAATHRQVRFSGMVQRITKTCLKPDIGCFVLFDGGFSGLVVINFSAAAAMELYETYMVSMGLPKEDLAISHTSDEVSNVMGELMNQIVGSFTVKVGRELQTQITQNQPKMLALNKQVIISVDTNLESPELRRVTFFTAKNNIFYLELAMDKIEFIKLHNEGIVEEVDPDTLIAQTNNESRNGDWEVQLTNDEQHEQNEQDDLFDSLGI